jgi:hypothetical protein
MSMADAMNQNKKSIEGGGYAYPGCPRNCDEPRVSMGPRPLSDTSFQEPLSPKEKRATRQLQGVTTASIEPPDSLRSIPAREISDLNTPNAETLSIDTGSINTYFLDTDLPTGGTLREALASQALSCLYSSTAAAVEAAVAEGATLLKKEIQNA